MDGYGQLAANAQLAVIASSAGRDWDGLYGEEVWHRSADFGLPAIPDHLLVFQLRRPDQAARQLALTSIPRDLSLLLT